MFKKNTAIGFNMDWNKIPDDNLSKQNLNFVYNNMSAISHSMSYVINGVPIIFDKRNTDISITFSGGADSTMLLFLLCSIITNLELKVRVHCITLLRFTEDRIYLERVVEDVITDIKRRFPNVEILQHIGFVPTALEMMPLNDLRTGLERLGIINQFEDVIRRGATADVYAVNSYSAYINRRYNISWQYSGTTTNPEHTIENEPVFRNPRSLQLKDLRGPFNLRPGQAGDIKNSPFGFIQKNWVMAQYKNFDIEDLLELTRSCEGSSKILNDKFGSENWTSRGSDYVCGNCFFCSERQWGIDNSNIFLKENCQKI
jgi:hypothetical protein